MRRVSKISTPDEFAAEIRREILRELRLNRRLRVTLLIVGGTAMAVEALLYRPGLISVALSWL